MFFSLWLKPEFSWTSINCFHGFLTCSDRESLSLSFPKPILTRKNIASTKNSQDVLTSQVSVLRINKATNSSTSNRPFFSCAESPCNTPIRLTQCCTQFKSPGDKILCVLYLHYNVAFTFKWYGNSWNKTLLFPTGLNWVQHWVSRIGLLVIYWSFLDLTSHSHGKFATCG